MPTPRTSEAIQTWGIHPKPQIISSQEEMFSPRSRTGIPIKGISHQIRLLLFRTYGNHRILFFHQDRRMWGLPFINNKTSNKAPTQVQNPGRFSLREMFILREGISPQLNNKLLPQMREMIQIWGYLPLRPPVGMFLQVVLGA